MGSMLVFLPACRWNWNCSKTQEVYCTIFIFFYRPDVVLRNSTPFRQILGEHEMWQQRNLWCIVCFTWNFAQVFINRFYGNIQGCQKRGQRVVYCFSGKSRKSRGMFKCKVWKSWQLWENYGKKNRIYKSKTGQDHVSRGVCIPVIWSLLLKQ